MTDTARIAPRYLTTADAARYLGISVPTFRRVIAAFPVARRPKPIVYPGVRVARWRVDDLDHAVGTASASSGWDKLVEGGAHVEGVGRRRGAA